MEARLVERKKSPGKKKKGGGGCRVVLKVSKTVRAGGPCFKTLRRSSPGNEGENEKKLGEQQPG